jgi:hypothetical protein
MYFIDMWACLYVGTYYMRIRDRERKREGKRERERERDLVGKTNSINQH